MTQESLLPVPEGLPQLSIAQRLVLPPADALPYVKVGRPPNRGNVTDDVLIKLIKRYREGATVRGLEKELGISDFTVKVWLGYAEEAHVLRVRRQSDVKAEKLIEKQIQVEEEILEKKVESADKDLKMAEALREKAQLLIDSITPGKVSAAKLKDLTDGAAKLITAAKTLLSRGQTGSSQSVVQYITYLNTLPMNERMKLADAQAKLISVTPLPEPQPEDNV